ncbi:hypothetical protein BC937DRAFT_88926 [Endogone sp. FLAS-F59071]|nr:hypothetical protein BC937DRAFT_88926 [Endogone sp. FLAS-F59071]|eukprot:RUS18319.1 hypothetical protein BC937DRAFT_88926 [Endogone sp. FLAS-F59071]
MDDDFDYNAIQEYEDQLYKDDGEHSQQSDVEETILSHVYYTNVFNKQTASTTTTATVTHEPQHVVPKLNTNGASFNDVETRSTIVDKKRPARDAHGSDNDEDKSDSRYSMIRRAEIAKKSEADHDVIDLVSSSESEGEDSDGDDDEGENAAAKNDMSVLEKGKMKATAQDLMGKEELMVTHIIDPDLLRDAEGEQEDGAEEYGYLDGEEFKINSETLLSLQKILGSKSLLDGTIFPCG